MAAMTNTDNSIVPFTLVSKTGREDYPEFSNHRCAYMASAMGEFHNFLLCAFNAVYAQAGTIKPGTTEATDFLHYSQIICEMLETHHHWEETSYLPAIEAFANQPGILASNVAHHEAFQDSILEFHTYCKQEQDNFTPESFRTLIHKFAMPLEQHLHEEPFTFYRLRHLDSGKLDEIYWEQEKIALSRGDPWKFLPMMLGSMDKHIQVDGLEEPLHKFPWYVRYVTYYVLAWRYKRLWKFNYTDFWGNRRKLHLE